MNVYLSSFGSLSLLGNHLHVTNSAIIDMATSSKKNNRAHSGAVTVCHMAPSTGTCLMNRATEGTIAGMTQKQIPRTAEMTVQKPVWSTYEGT